MRQLPPFPSPPATTAHAPRWRVGTVAVTLDRLLFFFSLGQTVYTLFLTLAVQVRYGDFSSFIYRLLLKYPFSVPFLVEPRSILSPGLLLSFVVRSTILTDKG
jgi:hypothetical protein